MGALGDIVAGKDPIFILYLKRLEGKKRGNVSFERQTILRHKYDDIYLNADLSWNCVEGMSAALRLQSPTLLACHQVASSWLTT